MPRTEKVILARCTYWLTLAVALGMGLTGMTRAEGQPVGLVLKTQGSVFVERSGIRQPLQLADVLYAGDTLDVASGEVGVLFCPANTRLSLAPGSSIELAAEKFEVLRGTAPEARAVRRCALPKVALSLDSQERIGGIRVRKAGLPELALYLGGPVASARPVFRWEDHAEAESFRLSLRDQQGSQIWQASSTDPQLSYPTDRPPLSAGVYEWEVEAMSGGRAIAASETRFEVRPAQELGSPHPGGDAAELLITAVELENAGYFAEAAHCYEQARGQTPSGENLKRHLAWLYVQAGLNRAAQRTLEP